MLKVILIAMLIVCTATFGQTTVKDSTHRAVAKTLIDSALIHQKGYQILDELLQMGPRLSGSETSLKAIHWARAKMEALGFDHVFLQPVMVPHWVRGDTESLTIASHGALKGHSLAITALGGSVGTGADGILAEVIEVNTLQQLRELGERGEGKIIFLNGYWDQSEVQSFRAYGRAVTHRGLGAIEAGKIGALACLIRSVTSRYDNVPHTGSMRRYPENSRKVPGAALGQLDADFLSQQIAANPGLKLHLKLSCQTLPDVQSYNVIADLTGSEKPDEIVLVSGHFDSWDVGDGAHDDATGCIQALEVLDLFKRVGIQPKRTVRCVFYINEENGIRGALEYAAASKENGWYHIAAMESDRGAFTPRGFSVDADSSIINHMQQWLPYLKMASIEWIRKGGSGVDVGQLKDAVSRIGYVPDGQRYFDYHHSANDVFEAVHPREFELGAAAMAILTYLISEEGLDLPQ